MLRLRYNQGLSGSLLRIHYLLGTPQTQLDQGASSAWLAVPRFCFLSQGLLLHPELPVCSSTLVHLPFLG